MERRCECGCIGWTCGACGRQCWSCSEGGADAYPELCDRCYCYVMAESASGEDPDEPKQMLRIMRLLWRAGSGLLRQAR